MADTETQREESHSIESIGQALFQRRQNLGYELAFVAKKLHLKVDQLEALEVNNRKFFPGRVYYLGFLKAYADFLDLDLKKSFEETVFEKQSGAERTTFLKQQKAKNARELKSLSITPRRRLPFFIFFSIGCSLTVIAYVGWYRISHPAQLSFLSEQVKGEKLESVIPPLQVPKMRREPKPILNYSMKYPSTAPVEGGQSVSLEKDSDQTRKDNTSSIKKISLVALKSGTVSTIIDQNGRVIYEGSMENGKKWVSPEGGGKYFISVNDASSIGIKMKSDQYRPLGKTGRILRNFKLPKASEN
ncbi:hypothetical protein FAI40_00400 [Acetobacteraceae bacterium]|nr:hypothetical protein FAI40_00400 [Acetobacteraceae bacterium]